MHDISEFKLSRVQAEGWKAAQVYLVNGNPDDEKTIALLNPYRTDLERARWYAGFNSAVAQL